MTRIDSYLQGTPCWIEHSGPDPEASRRFYADLLGWEYDVQPMRDGDAELGTYALALVHGDAVAGLGPQFGEARGGPAGWGVYLAADDVDAAVERAREAGGTVLAEPVDAGDQGRMAWVQDTVGAAVGLWQGRSFAGARRANEHGTDIWNELVSADVATAGAFYAAVLGIAASEMPVDGGDPYTTFDVAERPVGGVMVPQDPATPPHWNVYLNVDDADAVAARAVELGGQQVVAPFDVPGIGRMAVLVDPQGATFNLMQNPPAP